MGLRRSAITKIVAVWFVAMIVLPFTAPFQSFDLSGSSSSASHQALPKDKNDSDDKLVPPPDWSFVSPLLNVVATGRLAHASHASHRSVHHPILRL